VTLAAGRRIGPYEILAPLGAGGMGEVFRARDTRLGREVAIKALPASFAGDPERLARFEREARSLATLNHPNIAAIYGLEDSGGAPHLVLELVEGETLARRLERGPLPVGEALELCIQLAAAIEAAHERGIVHRDLKPGNLMRTPSGALKVLDFGLAKESGPRPGALDLSQSPTVAMPAGATAAGIILGTAAYMSPEQARGREVDRRTDVWSFGCILFESLAGRPAFEGGTVSDLIARILEREPDWTALPPGLPARAGDVLRRCLRKDANERPRDIRDVRLALAEVAAGGSGTGAAREQSIAVLPFVHAGGAEDEFFADGITEEILNALAQLEGLRVAARTSSFAFKGRREDLRQVGEKLNVATVLEGSVRRSGSRLRITAQLVNVQDGYQLWSERYDREMTDVFAVQDEIAGAIAAKLKLSLADGSERGAARGTTSVEAYALFLKGRALQYRRGRGIVEARACFEQAVALDPRYADALAWLADSYRLMGTFNVVPTAQVMPRARAAAERALAIDPGSAEAHATLASVEAQYERAYAQAMRSWERALGIDPRNVRARCERALWAVGFGGLGHAEATAEVERAVADDPLNAWAYGMLSLQHGMAGRHAEGVAAARRSIEMDARSYMAQWSLLRSLAWAGEHAQVLELAPAHLLESGRHLWTLGALAMAYASAGRPDLARAVYDELDARSRMEFVAPAWRAAVAGAAGRLDEGIRLLASAVEERDPFCIFMNAMPVWGPLRGHPGFPALVGRMGYLDGGR
jgi:serine/threonine-protein kinase